MPGSVLSLLTSEPPAWLVLVVWLVVGGLIGGVLLTGVFLPPSPLPPACHHTPELLMTACHHTPELRMKKCGKLNNESHKHQISGQSSAVPV